MSELILDSSALNFSHRIDEALPPYDASLVRRAYELARSDLAEACTRLCSVAEVLIGQHADHVVLCAVFLAPLRKAGRVSRRAILDGFGQEIASLAEEASRWDDRSAGPLSGSRQGLELLLGDFAHDLRAVVLRTGLRVVELERRTDDPDGFRDGKEQAHETLDVFVPIANRMGMRDLQRRLEDASFRLLEPERAQEIDGVLAQARHEDEACLELLRKGVQRLLAGQGIAAAVEARTKGLYSTWRKMRRLGVSVEDIRDSLGLRIITGSVPECYTVLGHLHTHFQPVAGTFDDYIGCPKENGYQSLHTTVYPVRDVSRKTTEFQIRTEAMHREAQHGIAAHWLYKSRPEAERADDRQVAWLESVQRQHEVSTSEEHFLARLREEVFGDQLVIFGPRGDRLEVPPGSTVQDCISRLGFHLVAGSEVRINGTPRPFNYLVRDGDTLELLAVRPSGLGGEPVRLPTEARRALPWMSEGDDPGPEAA